MKYCVIKTVFFFNFLQNGILQYEGSFGGVWGNRNEKS